MDKIYKGFKCNMCKNEFILLNNCIEENNKRNRYLTCPYCGFKHIRETRETDDLKECISHSVYKKVNGAIRQVR